MKVSHLWGSLLLCAAVCSAQQVSADPAQAAQAPSSLLQPALDRVARAGSGVDLNRWKGSNALREEVDANLASMQQDLQTTLPPLLAAADAAPDAASAALPVLLNIDALYDVLLRVTIASRTGAPRDQSTALEQAAMLLDSARRDLGESVLTLVKAQEKRMASLNLALQQQTVAPAAAPPATAPVGSGKRRKTGSAKAPAAAQ